jgi:hypothetical protein
LGTASLFGDFEQTTPTIFRNRRGFVTENVRNCVQNDGVADKQLVANCAYLKICPMSNARNRDFGGGGETVCPKSRKKTSASNGTRQ